MGIVTLEVDCHAYDWHVVDPAFPECGPDNLVRMAEQYGVLIRFLEDHPLSGWATWYEVKGPRDNVVRLLAAEYTGCDVLAAEMVPA